MTSWKLLAAPLLLAACDADPMAPVRAARPIGATGATVAATTVAPSIVVAAPGQLVTLEREGGETERAWFEARLLVRGGATDATPVADGAILVVSAADGPMPQTSPDAETLRIDVRSATLGLDGVVRFAGVATLSDARGESAPFDVEGSVQASASSCKSPDCLIWDILGGNVHETFPAITFLRVASGV